jgi:hypothetical protein
MTVYYQNQIDNSIIGLDVAAGQITHSAILTPGIYIAYAWLPGFSQGGAYAESVDCSGGDPACVPYRLIPFEVAAGGVTGAVDICNWTGQPADIPRPPVVTP